MAAVSIVIPAYNEEEAIGSVIDQIISVMEEADITNEIIVVDDGSTDDTYRIVKSLGVEVIRRPYNVGYGAALKAGIRAANSDIVITMDSDSQHNAEDIPKLLQYIGEYDMVVGARTKDSHSSWIRKPGKMILSWAANYLAGMKIPDLNCGFRAMKKDLVMRFLHILPNGFSFSTTITLAAIKEGYTVRYVPIITSEREGKSYVNPIRDGVSTILLIVRTIVLFDPLRVFLPTSAALFILGIAYLSYALLFRGFNIPDGVVLMIASSIIIFFFGILSDQVSAIRRESR
jgi:glycosyltransferase involved in cell wall biosynthesis